MARQLFMAAALLFVCVAARAQRVQCGDPLPNGLFNKVPALSNGHDMRTSASCGGRGTFGLQYQCVEFIKRYYTQALSVDTSAWHGNAADYFGTAKDKGLIPFENGSSLADPAPNDIIVFASPSDAENQNGHVAVVSAVTASSVEVVEQNWSPTGRATLSFVRTPNGGFLLKDRTRYKILGWLKLPPPGPPIYEITDIGSFPGAILVSPSAINNLGEVVGTAILPSDPNPVHGFIWTAESGLSDIFPPIADANSINNFGEIVGDAILNDQVTPFTLSNGIITNVGAITAGGVVTLRAINNLGTAVGQSGNLKTIIYANGQVTSLDTCTGQCISTPLGINDSGHITGFINEAGSAIPFYFEAGTVFSLGVPAGENAFAFGINNKDEVVGGIAGNGGHAFLWTKNAGLTDLGALFGFDFSEAHGINNNSQVVGTSSGRAFVWSKGFGMLDLNQQLLRNPGWILESATAINDQGQIIGTGELNGQPHAFLLTPTTSR